MKPPRAPARGLYRRYLAVAPAYALRASARSAFRIHPRLTSQGLLRRRIKKYAALRLDVGGTSLRALMISAVYHRGRESQPRMVYSKKFPTAKGVEPLLSQIKRVYGQACREAMRRNLPLLPLVAIGAPGRHELKRGRWVISRGTARNLARRNGEFDHLPLGELLSRRLGVSVEVRNDAAAQMMYGIDQLMRNGRAARVLRGNRVGYLGLGTGLGGGFVEVSKSGRLRRRTDGHVGNLLLQSFHFLEKRRGCRLQVRVSRKGARVSYQAPLQRRPHEFRLSFNRPMEVQDALSGPGLHRLLKGMHLSIPRRGGLGFGHSLVYLACRFEGEVLFRLIRDLHDGRVIKAKPWLKWPMADRNFVRNVNIFLWGGGLSDRRDFLKIMCRKFQERWAEERRSPVVFFTPPKKISAWAGAWGAGMLLDPEEIKGALGRLP